MPRLAQRLERRQLGLDQRLAAQDSRGPLVEAVELEVDLQPVPVLGRRRPTRSGSWARRMPLVLIITMSIGCSQAYSRIAEELGVDRRLAAGELQHLGAALDLDQPVDRAAALLEAQMLAARPAGGVAHRAVEVARRGDLDQADAGVLLVLGAQAAVVGAALLRLDAELARAPCPAG